MSQWEAAKRLQNGKVGHSPYKTYRSSCFSNARIQNGKRRHLRQ